MRIVLCCAAVALVFGTVTSAGAQSVPESRAEIAISFAPVVREAAPAVVNIHSARAVRSPFAGDPFLERFFGRPQSRSSSLGSGVIVTSDGIIVTNAHVVEGASEIRVSLADRREFQATVLLRDERTDLAVLKVEGHGFPILPFGDPAALEVGDLVLAIGNPFGVGQTVTQGIVSATARTEVGVADYRFFIQTDAAINPGNSGGALVDMAGRLVGINTAIYSRSGGSNGIGFAIPADIVRLVAQSAIDGEPVRRPWLGARLQSVDAALAEGLALQRPVGALITEVIRGGPAERADLRVADVILALDGAEVTDVDAFDYLFATRGTSGNVTLSVSRGGSPFDVTLGLEAPPETVPRDPRRIGGRSPFTGAIAINLSPAVADELNLELTTTGVAIARVDRGSLAARVGLKAGDRIVEVNGLSVPDTETLERIVAARVSYWEVVVERDGRLLSLLLGG